MSKPYCGPDAAEVAAILVCAAIETDEGGGLAAAIVSPPAFAEAALRCRWVALAALIRLYPNLSARRLGAMLGKTAYPAQCLTSAKKAGWWSDDLVARVVAEAA